MIFFHQTWINLTLWRKRSATYRRLRRVEDFSPLGVVHHFRLDRAEDLDADLEALLAEAYATDAQTASAEPATAPRRPRPSARTSHR